MSLEKKEEPKKDGAEKKKDNKKQTVSELLAQEELVSIKCSNLTNHSKLQSAEDEALKEKLELCSERLSDKDAGLRK